MKILIIEDELPAFRRISKMFEELVPEGSILGHADSIKSATRLFSDFPEAELALMDIELADGQSFEIFDLVEVKCPVIFTTAYDEFALKAFKVNSIDYLLKPILKDDLEKALKKYRNLRSPAPEFDFRQMLLALQNPGSGGYRQRFLVKAGSRLIKVNTGEIAYFMASEKLVYIVTSDNRKFVVDHSLDELSKMVDPASFFQLNRQFLANMNAIDSVSTYFNGKLKVQLNPGVSDEVVISRERAIDFKNWLNS